MKKIVILSPHGHRLANQLWNFMGIYSYCLERGYACENPSFFRYVRFFDIPNNTLIGKILSLLNNTPFSRTRGWSYMLFEKYVAWVESRPSKQVISDKKEPHVFRLPPSQTTDREYLRQLEYVEQSENETFYFKGWLFRNPVGIEKYRKEIGDYFAPNQCIRRKIDATILPLRKKFKTIVGVHIRQGDYRDFQQGRLFFTQIEVLAFIKEYMKHTGKDPEETVFVLCSDEILDPNIFSEIHTIFPRGDAVEDLFTLAKTDVVIGPDSTFGAFASYYGNIPFIVLDHNGVDWKYYQNKQEYFENKKNTLTFF